MPASIIETYKNFRHRLHVVAPDVFVTVMNVTQNSTVAELVEVADTSAKRRKGLLGRNGLPKGKGLLIRPCESVHTFAMRFPIDLIYLDRAHRVQKVRHAVGPWRVSACLRAHSVIELAAGTIADTGTCRGDQLRIIPVVSEQNGIEICDQADN